MAGDKYIKNSGGTLTEQAAIQSSAGAGDAGKLVALDAAGLLAQSMMPTGIGPDTKDIPTSENLAAGDYVNIWDDTGTAKVRKADGSSIGKEAHGFVLAAVTSPANAAVYFEGKNNQLSGLLLVSSNSWGWYCNSTFSCWEYSSKGWPFYLCYRGKF